MIVWPDGRLRTYGPVPVLRPREQANPTSEGESQERGLSIAAKAWNTVDSPTTFTDWGNTPGTLLTAANDTCNMRNVPRHQVSTSWLRLDSSTQSPISLGIMFN